MLNNWYRANNLQDMLGERALIEISLRILPENVSSIVQFKHCVSASIQGTPQLA